jgi:hypothetical protein
MHESRRAKQDAPGATHSAPAQGAARAGKPGTARAQAQLAAMIDGSERMIVQRALSESIQAPARNNTGLPDGLKAGIEQLSGYSMDDVKVHYNAPRPAQLQAHAYAQGTEIHLAQGQEHHLPHEAWHVVQQKQGRVSPTTSVGGVSVNDDAGLEAEADRMGARALVQRVPNGAAAPRAAGSGPATVQRARVVVKHLAGFVPHWEAVIRNFDKPLASDGAYVQIGFANPRAWSAMSGSVSTKGSGSSSGIGGDGEVNRTNLTAGTTYKDDYTPVETSTGETNANDKPNSRPEAGAEDGRYDAWQIEDVNLGAALPAHKARMPYRLTSGNCQHFVARAWANTGLTPDVNQHLTVSEEGGQTLNGAIGGGLGATGAALGMAALGGAALLSLPMLGAVAAGGYIGHQIGKQWNKEGDRAPEHEHIA